MSSRRSLAGNLLLLLLIFGSFQTAHGLPAFARKYGLRCSACHESWPMLNYFGQKFKDNGYQLMNDRDAPIWQNPSYWPVTFRITPIWHRVSTGKVMVALTDRTARAVPWSPDRRCNASAIPVSTLADSTSTPAAHSRKISPSTCCRPRITQLNFTSRPSWGGGQSLC